MPGKWEVAEGRAVISAVVVELDDLAHPFGAAAVADEGVGRREQRPAEPAALGEGARLYVANQFGSLGLNLISVLPFRSALFGVAQLRRDDKLEPAGGISYVTSLANSVPTAANAGRVRGLGPQSVARAVLHRSPAIPVRRPR